MADSAQATPSSQTGAASAALPRVRPLANRNFRLLWLGETVSLFGDQFYIVALPWLVFQITGSSLAFGTILMVAGIPRAVLMLIGGVMTDRFSPRSIMIGSNLLRLILTVLLTLAVATGITHLWMLYGMAFCFGIVDAFFHPAYRAMIPIIATDAELQASNSLMLGSSQLAQIAGPGMAGVLVHAVGVAASFAFDALTFLFTWTMLLLMRPTAEHSPHAQSGPAPRRRGVLGEIGEMVAFVRRDELLPTVIVVVAAINLLSTGPLIVGSATLSKVRFSEGSAAFGALLSSFSGGMLIGTLAAGAVHLRRPGLISLLLVAAEGVFMVGIGYTARLTVACGLLVLVGFGSGFGNVNVITLTQKRVSKELLGRFMSLVVLAEVGLTPISNALAGVLADLSVTTLYVAAGIALAITALLATTNRAVRAIEL